MLKIAIISPGFLPVPAIKGGAIEQLTENIIVLNEKQNIYNIDLYTIHNDSLTNFKYKNTNIIDIKTTIIDKIRNRIYNYGNKLIGKPYNHNIPYTYAVNKRIKDKTYDYIIVENNMSIVIELPKTDNMIFHLHNDIFGIDKPLEQCKIVAKKCKRIITVSEYIKNRFLMVDKNIDVQVLPNCIDFNEYDINRFNKDSIKKQRDKWGISDNDFVFIFTGRICKEKGVVELIKAFNRLSKQNSDMKLLVLGDYNVAEKDLKEFVLASKYNNNNIKLLGYIDQKDIPLSLYSSDVVVVPSKWQEPFGLVSLEPMAMRKPIIATKVGGMVEQLDDDCAVMVDIDNLTDNLYKAMKYLYENKDIREIKANRAYELVFKNKNYDVNNYLTNFDKIINNRKKNK